MQPQPVMELMEVERIARQLRLLNDVQAENLVGCWERQEGDDHFFWSDSMFALHEIPIHPGNIISIEEANGLIFHEDSELLNQKRAELEQTGFTDYYLRIQAPDNKLKRIHAREKRVVENNAVLYRGNWRDELTEREFQRPAMEKNDRLAIQLKVFERAEEVAQTGSWQINLETFETVYSDNVYRIYGLLPQSIQPHVDSFRKYIHPEDRAVVLRSWEKAYVEIIPLHLEYRIIREDGEIRFISQVSHLIRNSKGDHILSGNTRDITEQKLLELQLREANEVLTLQNELFLQSEQISQLGTWQVNLDTRKTVYSSNLYRLYGLKPYSVAPGMQNFIQYVDPDDRDTVQNAFKKAMEEHVPPELEFRIVRADGKPRTLRQKSRRIKTEGEELLIGIVQDITDQLQKDKLLKEANEKLLVQNESFRQAEKVAGVGYWTWNIDSNEMFYSDNVYNIYGIKPQSMPPGYDSFGKYMHPEDRKWLKAMPEQMRSALEPMSFDYRIIRADGELRYLRSKNQPITTPEEHRIIIGTTQDITSEVQMQQQLMEKISFAELLGNTILDRIIVTDTSNNIVSWNKSCEEFYGQKKEDVLGQNFFDVLPHFRIPQVTERFKKALSGESIHVPVMPGMQVMGQFQEVFIVPLKNEQHHVIGVLHVMHDITRQQHLQEELSGRLQFIEKLLEASIDRIMVLDKDLHFQLWNRQCEKYYGLSKEQVIGKNILEVFPRFKADPLYQHCLRALEGETVHVPPNEKAGLQGYQEYYFVPLRNEIKEVTGLLWTMHDLTERYIAEQRLRTSETHLRAAQEIAMMGSYEMELPEGYLNWSDETYKIFDYPMGEPVTMDDVDARVHPDDLEHIHLAVEKMRNGYRKPVDSYFRIITQSGQIKHLHSRTQLLFNEENAPIKLLGIVQDITAARLAEEELQESQHFSREVADSVPDLIYVLDLKEQKVVFVNNRADKLLGHNADAVYPSGISIFRQVLHEEDFQMRMDHVSSLADLKDHEISQMDVRMVVADGSWRWFTMRDRVFKRDSEGKVWQIIGTAQDITDQKLANAQISRQQELLRQAEEIAHIGSWELDTENEILFWSDEIYRIYGYAPQTFEANLKFYLETIHPEDRVLLRAALDEAMRGAAFNVTCRIFTLDGELRYIHTRGKAITDDTGKVRRIVGTLQDVTAHKLMESELRKRNYFMRTQFEMDRLTEKTRNVGSWQWDVKTDNLVWTEKMYRLFGLKQHSFELSMESFISLIHSTDRERIRRELDDMKKINEGPLPDYEFRLLVNDKYRYFRVSSRMMGDRNIVGTTMDITQDALLRQELSDKIRQLEEMNEELSSFAFVASHDLREPLRKIQIFSDWLCRMEEKNLSAEGADRFRRIQAAVVRMEALIDDILNFSSLQAGEKHFSMFSLEKVLQNVKSDLQEAINESGAVIEARELPEIRGSESQFHQLFQNLLANAIKYRKPEVAPHICVGTKRADGKLLDHPSANHDMQYLEISFADNGIGFDQQYAKKIFQMFQRLHGMHEFPGTGMGLAICKKIVEYHGGFIIAEGTPGVGAAFHCYVPLTGKPLREPAIQELNQ